MSPDSRSAYFDEAFADQTFMVILRGMSPVRTVELCSSAWDSGITQVEVPIQASSARESLEAAIAAGAAVGRQVGAGTVTTVEQVRFAAQAGASFTVAPGLDESVAAACAAQGIPHLPGVATAGEIQRALALGLDWVKAFPASVLGPAWVTSVLAPFPDLKIVATGGMNAELVEPFLHAGSRVVALGASFGDPGQRHQLDRLRPVPGT